MFFVTASSSVPAGRASHLHRGVIGIARRDHLDALARGVLRGDALVLDARRRDHHGLRHHHGAVLRGRAVRDDGARGDHHGLVDGAVLRLHVLLLIAGLARRRCVAIVAAGGGCARHGNRGDGGRENNSESTRHCGGAPVAQKWICEGRRAVYAAKSRAAELRRGILNANGRSRPPGKNSLTTRINAKGPHPPPSSSRFSASPLFPKTPAARDLSPRIRQSGGAARPLFLRWHLVTILPRY
jgi:hypothetical protein